MKEKFKCLACNKIVTIDEYEKEEYSNKQKRYCFDCFCTLINPIYICGDKKNVRK